MDRPSWAFSDTAIIFKYYEDSSKRVFVLEGLDHHFDILSLFTPKDYLLITIPCHVTEWNPRFALKCLEDQNPGYPPSNITFLANTKEQELQARSVGFKSIFFNQNALLDEATYWLERDAETVYDLVLNTRPERNFKRPYLAKSVPNLAVIQGYNFRKDDYMDLHELEPAFLNETRLTTQDVVQIYNQSMVGGIFSEKEGACYSSSEYLLCGLPVISTPSEGGRDVWYNKWNSIICDPTESAVQEAVSLAKYNLATGIFNTQRIRAMHVSTQYKMRDTFCSLISKIGNFSEAGSWSMLHNHLLKTNKLQHKIKMNMVESYLVSPLQSH
jgi:glycosyltransferase involved in cell wall biosynthesis